jgi:hypothetical protein
MSSKNRDIMKPLIPEPCWKSLGSGTETMLRELDVAKDQRLFHRREAANSSQNAGSSFRRAASTKDSESNCPASFLCDAQASFVDSDKFPSSGIIRGELKAACVLAALETFTAHRVLVFVNKTHHSMLFPSCLSHPSTTLAWLLQLR